MSHDLSPAAILPYFCSPRAGRRKGAVATITNTATGNRITVRFRRTSPDSKVLFVDLMTGPDNESSYSYLGIFKPDERIVQLTQKCKVSIDKAAVAAQVLNWTLRAAAAQNLRTVRVQHAGVCGRCGRTLTVPESLDKGLGPECAHK